MNHMELEKQVCSLELAKRLKTLGVKQESVFYWVANAGHSDIYKLYHRPNWKRPVSQYWLEGAYFSAFTVAELFKEHYDRFGVCDVPSKIEPKKLADHLARTLSQKLASNP